MSFNKQRQKNVYPLLAILPSEAEIPMNSITIGKYNHAVLIRDFAFAVTSGIEQRDVVIKFEEMGPQLCSLRITNLLCQGLMKIV